MEMRAIWHNLPNWDEDSTNPIIRGKVEWKEGFKSKMDNYVYKEAKNTLPIHLLRHPAYEVSRLLLLLFL